MFRSCPRRSRKFQKNCNKIQKIKKFHYGFFSSQNRLENQRKRKNKIYRLVSFLPDPELKIPENEQKKIKKLKNTITA